MSTIRMTPRHHMVLQMMREPNTVVPGYNDYMIGNNYRNPDDPPQWFRLRRVPNIGPKTINELIALGKIEGRCCGSTIAGRGPDLFRLINDEADFGDLWVAEG